MPEPNLIFRSHRVVLPDGMRPATLVVTGGRITDIHPYDVQLQAPEIIDAGPAVVIPGLVDTHVHVNDPGRTDWEGFETATRAAAAGGVTTIVDMPLNSEPVTTTVDALNAKRRAANGRSRVDYACWGGVIPGNADSIVSLDSAGVPGFKCFMVPSGIDSFPAVDRATLRIAMEHIAVAGSVLLAHAEDSTIIHAAHNADTDGTIYANYLASRPGTAEAEAVAQLIVLCAETKCRVHIVHVAASEAIAHIRAARQAGLPITAETCPHYLTFSSDEIPDGSTIHKCAPPIRDAPVREQLWAGLLRGDLDLIASDHSPCPPAIKSLETGDFRAAWGGIASLQLGLPAILTGAHQRGIGIERIVEWMAAGPSRLARIDDRKGRIAIGTDADLVLVDPDKEVVIDPAMLYHRHPQSPYVGMTLRGQVCSTFLRGQCIYHHDPEHETFPGDPAGHELIPHR